jgi:putative PEP-CTERM system histidine kinase
MPGTLAYLLTALAAAIGCALLLAKSRTGNIARRAAIACAVSAAWALILAGQHLLGAGPSWSVLIAEALRYAAWLAFLSALAPADMPSWVRRVFLALVVVVAGYGIAGWVGDYSHRYSLRLIGGLSTAGLVLAFAGLTATEQAMRNAAPAVRRDVRLCAIGAGGQFAFDLFLYSQSQLLGGIDTGAWATRGLVTALLFIPFVVGARRVPAAEVRFFVSRHMVFYTTAFVAVGGYLSLMALGGYQVREHTGTWGNALQVAFLFGAGGILALLIWSESPLRRLRVFIATHFYRNKYDYRIEWMRFVATLSLPDEPDIHKTAVRAVAQIFGNSGGLLFLHDEDTNRYVLRASWPESYDGEVALGAFSADDPLPAFLRERQWVIDVREFAQKPQIYGQLALPPWVDAGGPWRVVAPLLLRSYLLGFLILRAPPEPFSMDFEDRDLLKTVGRNVAVQLAQHRADEKLSQNRQFDAYNRFAAFVMHDLKNSAAQLQLLVDNAARHRSNPVFVDDAIDTIHNTAQRMTRLIEQLQSRDMQGATRPVDLAGITRAAVERSAARQPAVVLQLAEQEVPVKADPERLGAVIDHVIRNAQEATPAGRTIAVRLEALDDEARLHVIDEGAGMDVEFVRHRLFRPFDSTKGSKGMGIGAYQTREYARWLGGDVEVQSSPGTGTDFCIRLPLCQKKNPDS